ncbi:MAG: rod shape-determining protein MreB [Selenomonas sp.]|uniref:rod shape-determining protein n=1 Tax=Selenomonas sp. AE3005 TaxID=1485543 RepID=UPI0004897CC1|nr:rod shape-determining protein MreB [Selenomonas sp. AE3005]MBQ2086493.1 rod shape-determining protein MreB [Selenomonas sp.]
MFGMSLDIGIDLGTANVLVYVKGKGIVLREPSVVAIDRDTNRVLAIGEEARQMIGRTPGNIVAVRPLREGVIADYDITESMLRHFIEKVVGRRFVFRPRIMICIPSGVTMVEQRAVQEAAEQAGARHTQLIEEPLAAALGAGLDISEPRGSMVVDIGGGTTDIAVISLGGIVNSASLRVAGDKFDEDIMAYVKKEFNIMIGERTAEDVKMVVGAAFATARNEVMDIRGRDMLSGLPKNVQITTAQAAEAMRDSVTKIVDCVKKVLEETPPELAADIMNCGIVLTGGGAMLYGLDELIRRETDIPTALAEEAMSCVAIGCGKALDSFSKFDGKARNVKTGR